MARLTEKVALITGAGSGLGRAMALRFAAEGARVMVADLDPAGGAATVAATRAGGGEAELVRADVSRAEEVAAMVAATVERWGRLDILVNNAGIERFGGPLECSEADWERVLRVDLTGPFLCVRAAVPAMPDGAAILNIASVAGVVGIPGASAYCAAKGGLINLTRSLALDLSGRGIRVNCLCPGTTLTPMGERLLATDDEASRAARLRKYPTGRFGQPDEIASAALFLCSAESAFTTGAVFVVDGGMTAL